MSEQRRRRQQERCRPKHSFTAEEIAAAIVAIIGFILGVLPVIPFWLRFGCIVLFWVSAVDWCLRSDRAKHHSPISRLVLSVVVSLAIVAVFWNPMRKQYSQEHLLPSLVYITPDPIGDYNSPVWLMSFKHFGPTSAFNCKGSFSDLIQSGEETIFHRLAGPQPLGYEFNFQEADPIPGFGDNNFRWIPRNPNGQHYQVDIHCRDGQFLEDLIVARIDGIFRIRLNITRAKFWVEHNPELDREVYSCDESFLSSTSSLLPSFVTDTAPYFNPDWQPNHLYRLGTIIQPGSPGAGNSALSQSLQKQIALFPVSYTYGSCWALFNGPYQHLGEPQLPLNLSGFQLLIIACIVFILVLPLYCLFAFWIMG
jgi:hypothetical protein